MKRRFFIGLPVLGALLFTWDVISAKARGQAILKDRCPLCGNGWDGTYPSFKVVPAQLERPKNQEWLDRLRQVLGLEMLSRVQYENDARKFRLHMPYHMVIPQESNHIEWLQDLLTSYGESTSVKRPPTTNTSSPEEAISLAMRLERELFPHYEWLLSNAEDGYAADVINTVFLQTRMHYSMFEHALNMGGMGHGRGGRGGGRRHRGHMM